MNLSDRQTAGHQPLRRVNAMEALLSELRAAIEGGSLAVGDRLPSEAALCQEYGVSRSVVREALRALQALGLTQSRTGKGTYVVSSHASDSPTFGAYSAQHLLEVRRHIEVPAAGYAATRHTPEDLAALNDLLDRMDAETDEAFWVSLDSLFHITVARASGNPVFGKVIEEIRDALAVQSAFVNQLDNRREASNVEHRRIVEAIVSGATDAAELAMCTHLDHVDEAVGHIVGRTSHPGATAPEKEKNA